MIELKEYIERHNNLHDRLFCQSSINELATYFGESINDIPVDIQEQYIAGQFDLNEYLLETLKSHDSEALTKFLKKEYKSHILDIFIRTVT